MCVLCEQEALLRLGVGASIHGDEALATGNHCRSMFWWMSKVLL